MKKILIAALTVSMIVCVSSCKSTEDFIGKTGVIIEKDYDKAHTTLIPHKIGNITTFRPVHHKEKYKFKIQFEEEVEWFKVPESTYAAYETGQFFTISEDCYLL